MKTFAIFLLSKETFMIKTCCTLASFFRKLLLKATFERKLSSVSQQHPGKRLITFSFCLIDMYFCSYCLQCFNAIGWASGRASRLQKIE